MAKVTSIKDANYLKEVRNQYENYPYPARDPQNDKKQFYYCNASAFDCINHYIYAGKRDFSRKLRVLVAGGGTGDATIMLAEQLRESEGEIVHLDISQASINIVQERAKVRGLTNIQYIHGSLLDAPEILEGKFDHINCIGVLHHLASPEAGLAALKAVLQDDGMMALMLYARPGREMINQMHHLMQMVNTNEHNMRTKIGRCKAMIQHLPVSNPFKKMESIFKDIRESGDAGIYDLLLHSHNTAYDIRALYQFVESADLKINHFLLQGFPCGNQLYNPEFYINDDGLRKAFYKMSVKEKHAVAELIHGGIMKHVFFASANSTLTADLNDLNNVPYFAMMIHSGFYQQMYSDIQSFAVGQEITLNAYNIEIRFVKTRNAEYIFKVMNGNKSMKQIFHEVLTLYPATQKKPTANELKQEFKIIFEAFNLQDWMFLRAPFIPKPKTIDEIQSRLNHRH